MAKKKQKSKANQTSQARLSPREKREQARAEATKQRRNQNMILVGAGVLLLALVGALVYSSIRVVPGVANELTFSSQGNSHVGYGQRSTIRYNSTPPSSGPHYGGLAAWGVHEEPVRYEQLIHNLEDGGVIIYYQCEEACPELVEQITEISSSFIDAGRHVAIVPNNPEWRIGEGQPLHEDMGAKIALTAWTKVLKLDEYDGDKIKEFIIRYEGIDHHNSMAGL